MNPFAGGGGMPRSGIGNPFAAGVPFRDLVYNAPTAAMGYNANAASPMVGSWSVAPRQQLAQIISDDRFRNSGKRAGGFSGGYTTSGPQRGGFGYGGGMGGWGRAPGGTRSSATRGSSAGWGGGLY